MLPSASTKYKCRKCQMDFRVTFDKVSPECPSCGSTDEALRLLQDQHMAMVAEYERLMHQSILPWLKSVGVDYQANQLFGIINPVAFKALYFGKTGKFHID